MGRRRKVPIQEPEGEEENVEPPVPKFKKPNPKEKPAKKLKQEPDWLNGDGNTVAKLILTIQKSECNSIKIIAELTKLYNKMGHDPFMAVFMKVVTMFMIRDENDDYAPRVLKFLGSFIASFGEYNDDNGSSHAIIQHAFKHILSITSKEYYVRARICLLVTHIMSSFSHKAEIDENLMDKVIDRMVGTFIRDISPVVRQNAIMALQRLQDPDNPEDMVTKAYLYHMEMDPISKVRQSAITAIAKKLNTIKFILDRLHDSDEKVRRHTYLQIASFPVKSYQITDRIKILQAGLHDRSDMVKKTVNNILLSNWIGVYENDFANFIKAFKMDSSDKDLLKFRTLAQDALKEVFKKQKIAKLVEFLNLTHTDFPNCIPIEKSSHIEWLIVWKMTLIFHQEYVEGKHKFNDDGHEDGQDLSEAEDDKDETMANINIMPELSVLCDYIEKISDDFKVPSDTEAKYQQLNFNHCLITLLEIAQLNDFGDEIGRGKLQNLLRKILIEHHTSEHTVKEIAHVIELLISDVGCRLTFFNDIVNEMIRPGTPCEYSRQSVIEDLISKAGKDIKVRANSLKMQLMELKEQESKYVTLKQYAEAQKVSEKFVKINDELVELLRHLAEESNSSSLTMVESLLSVAATKKITSSDIVKNLRICFFAVTTKGMKVLTPEVRKIYDDFVRFHMESTDIATRTWALKSATAYSLLYETIANEVYVILKSQIFKSNNVVVWETAINCIIDLLLRYTIEKMESNIEGSEEMSTNNISQNNRSKKTCRTLYTEDGEDTEDIAMVQSVEVIQLLIHVLDNNIDKNVYKSATIGMCKLIIHGRFCTRDIMSRFLISYFNPATDPEINQILGNFFESIVRLKKQESLMEALISTLITLLEAPYDSPLREVKHDTVLKYVIGATRPLYCSNGLNLHNLLALKLIELMSENLDNKEIFKTLSKELLTLEISEDPLLKRDLLSKMETLLESITVDLRTRKNFTDFRDILMGTYKPALKFSSTGMTTNIDIDEDAGNPEEGEEDPRPSEVFNVDDVLDYSISQINLLEAVVNVTKMSMSQIDDDDDPMEETLPDVNDENHSKIVPIETSSNVNEPNDVSIRDKSLPMTQEVDIPETQEPDAEIESSDDEQNKTVVEKSTIASEIIDDDVVPATPESPQVRVKTKRTFAASRQLNLSVNSPLRKNPRNTQTPKQLDKTSSTDRNKSISSPLNKTVETPGRTLRTPSRRQVSSPMDVSKNTPVKSAESSGGVSKTPSRRVVTSAPSTPKTPKFSTLASSKSSTPNTDRVTRKQAKDDFLQSAKLTRSASQKLNVDVSQANQSLEIVKKTPKKPSKPVAVAKTSIPVLSKQIIAQQKEKKSVVPKAMKPTTSAAAAASAVAKKASTSNTLNPVTAKLTSRQASSKLKKEAKVKNIKQRPRWH